MKKTRQDRKGRTTTKLLQGAAIASGALLLASAGVATVSGASASPITISVTQNKTWGSTLTLKDGHTLYRLTKDSKNMSVCTGKCATVWLPVVLATGQKTPLGNGVSRLGSFTRANGTHQVTYEGIPLYTFTGDKKADEITGNVKDTWGQWWSINPSSPLTPPKKKGGSTTTTTSPGGGIAY